jgi:CotS family spore coat protein
MEQYELEIKGISRGRDGYICETQQGFVTLKVYRGSKERAEFLADMLEHLQREGIQAETVIRTREGETLSVGEDETKYILSTSFTGAECDTKNRDDMLAAVSLLAQMHCAAERYQGNIPEFVRAEKSAQLLLCEKHNRELRKVRNYIRAKKKKNEFEMLFANQYERFMEKAEQVTALLKSEQQEIEAGFCHGDYNQHNVIFHGRGTAILRFDNFVYQENVSDLANFMRKMLEKNNWNVGLGIDMIQAYHNERKLSQQELQALYRYMAYPEKFWKVANHYYNSHKAWLSGRNIEKLEKLIRQEDAREQFLQMLFHFVSK